jgi:hypothetical protein
MIVVFSSRCAPLGAAEHVEGHVLELDTQVVRDQLTTGQGRDVSSTALRRSPNPGAFTAAT